MEIDGLGRHLRRSKEDLVRCDMAIKANSKRVRAGWACGGASASLADSQGSGAPAQIPSISSFRSRPAQLKPGSRRNSAVAAWKQCRKAWAWTDYEVAAAVTDGGALARRRARVVPALHVAVLLMDKGRRGRVTAENVQGQVVVPLGEALGEFSAVRDASESSQGRHKCVPL